MLTITKEELEPKFDEFYGSVGRIVTDADGDLTGTVIWQLVRTEDEFQKAHDCKDYKTLRVKRMSDLMRSLKRRLGQKPIGSTDLIEVPEISADDASLRWCKDADRSPRIIQFDTPQFRNLLQAARHLKRSGEKKTWVYRGGSDPPPRDPHSYCSPRNGLMCGIQLPSRRSIWDQMAELIPEEMCLVRDGVDITSLAIENKRRTIPLKGGYGLRPADIKGMSVTSLRLVALAPENFSRAVRAAIDFRAKPGSVRSQKPMVYKDDLVSLLGYILEEIRDALGREISMVFVRVEGNTHVIPYAIESLVGAFRMAERIVGLEGKLWKKGDYTRKYGFVPSVLQVWRNRGCLAKWMEDGKYNHIDELMPYILKYGARCHRELLKRKRQEELTAKLKKKQEVKDHEKAEPDTAATASPQAPLPEGLEGGAGSAPELHQTQEG